MKTLGNRLFEVRKQKKLTQKNLATKTGVSHVTISQWEKDETSPKGDNLFSLAKALECSPEWLQTGISPPEYSDDSRFSQIPILDVELAAGVGTHIDLETVTDWVPIDQDWIYQNGFNPANLSVVYVKGDSMTPKLEDGDMLLINTAVTRPVSGKIYAIAVDDELRVKRLMKRMDGNWLITSDNKTNPEYQDEIIAPNNFESLRIIGQAVKVLMGSL